MLVLLADELEPASLLLVEPEDVLEAPDDEPEEPLLRKSVTYQPEPLSWKPAAVTCLT
ncbi:MAG TPA: hypothetical protein VKZ70_11045 [Burkholderiaceae bacterium]|nr:hypothetical protein [Burkholderiaceae bacterium]